MIEQDAAGRLATVRLVLGRDPGGIVVDVLFASSGIEPEVTAGAGAVELVRGLVVPVAQVGHLIALKLLARDDETRPQDRADLRALLDAADNSDLKVADDAVGLISARGYARGRDLAAALAALLAVRPRTGDQKS